MSRRIQSLGILLVALTLGACGGSSGSGGSKSASSTAAAASSVPAASGGASPGPSAASPPTSQTTASTSVHQRTGSTSTAAKAPAPRPGGAPAKRAAGHDGGAAISPGAASPAAPGSGSAGGGGRNAPQEKTLTVQPGGTVTPTSLTLPSVPSIELRVVSRDGRSRRIVLRTTTPQMLTVPPHGKASVLVTGLTPGRYVLDVDGLARGALLVGG